MHKLLIIDDDPYVVRLYQRLFALENYSTEVAADGQDGLHKAKSFKPDLILLDIMMPIMNGLETLQHLKADPETKDTKIIMLTNVGEDSIVEIAQTFGAQDYLVKSNFTPDEVLKKVRQYLVEKQT